jgi:hypothetical protein
MTHGSRRLFLVLATFLLAAAPYAEGQRGVLQGRGGHGAPVSVCPGGQIHTGRGSSDDAASFVCSPGF